MKSTYDVMDDKINILCSIDAVYDRHLLTMLASLFENNTDESFRIFLVGQKLDNNQVDTITAFVNKYGNELIYIEADERLLEGLPEFKFDFISIIAYIRCFMTEYLPIDIHKIIYLDCDLLVLRPIRPLWETNVDDVAVAVVEDMWAMQGAGERLGYDDSVYSYFNSGVLLVNLDYWRSYKVTDQVSDFLDENREKLLFADQDILNGIFYDKKKWLSPQYNMQDGFYRRRRRKMSLQLQKTVDQYLASPVILHYTGSHKPWQFKCYHPLKNEYTKYRKMIPYAVEKPDFVFKDWLEMKVNGILYALHLLKRKYRVIKK